MLVGEGTGLLAIHAAEGLEALAGEASWWLLASPRPPTPTFVVAGVGTATVAICTCIELTQRRADATWVVALVATGQLAFTWYIGHAVAILVLLQHGWFDQAPLWASVACSVAFFAAAIGVSLWRRRRHALGPLEGLIRQLTGRTTPAPWGGGLA